MVQGLGQKEVVKESASLESVPDSRTSTTVASELTLELLKPGHRKVVKESTPVVELVVETTRAQGQH